MWFIQFIKSGQIGGFILFELSGFYYTYVSHSQDVLTHASFDWISDAVHFMRPKSWASQGIILTLDNNNVYYELLLCHISYRIPHIRVYTCIHMKCLSKRQNWLWHIVYPLHNNNNKIGNIYMLIIYRFSWINFQNAMKISIIVMIIHIVILFG